MLTLPGVNDGNLVELSRLCGVKVALRGDAMSITGPSELVEHQLHTLARPLDHAASDLRRPLDELRGPGDGHRVTPERHLRASAA